MFNRRSLLTGLGAAFVMGDAILGTESLTRTLPSGGHLTLTNQRLLGNVTVTDTLPDSNLGGEAKSFQISGRAGRRDLAVRELRPGGLEKAMAYIRERCTDQGAMKVGSEISARVAEGGACLLRERAR